MEAALAEEAASIRKQQQAEEKRLQEQQVTSQEKVEAAMEVEIDQLRKEIKRLHDSQEVISSAASTANGEPEDQRGLYVGGMRVLAEHMAGNGRVPPPTGWLVNHLLNRLGLAGYTTKTIVVQGKAASRDLAKAALIFFRTAGLKEAANIAIKDFAREENIRGLFTKDTLAVGVLPQASDLNLFGLILRKQRLITSFKVINRQSQPVLTLVRKGRKRYEDATESDLQMAASRQRVKDAAGGPSMTEGGSQSTGKREGDRSANSKSAKKGKIN